MKKHEFFHVIIMIYHVIISLFKFKRKESTMLSISVIESITSFILTAIINEISAHSAKIAALNLQQDVTTDALDSANKKLISLLNAIAPYESFVAAKVPELAPVIALAQSYVAAIKE
jgi:hypothetical protein